MYPQVNKEVPSAPPSYADSMNDAKNHSGAPQYPGFQPEYSQQVPPLQQPQVIVVQAGIPPLGPRSVQLICPTCKAGIQSNVEIETSTSAYLCCMLMFVVGLALCSCLPFCMENFKTFKHTCPRCNAFIGTYQQQ